jgi:hypothetical protein
VAVEEAVVNGDIVVNSAFGDAQVGPGLGCANMPATTFDVSEYLGS